MPEPEVNITEQEREKHVFRYTARYGQRPETEAVYRDAIQACQSIENLQLTITEIARMHGVKPECLRNQLKRHFPEVIQQREQLRDALGYSVPGNRGLKVATVKKYAPAIELLRDATLTVREVAQRCGVSYLGLQQHLIFYHKDIADSRMLFRTDALLKPVKERKESAIGGVRSPRPETVAHFASALELYRTSALTLPEISERCHVNERAFASYLKNWYPEERERRKQERERKLKEKKEAEKNRPDRSGITVARKLYTPAITLLQQGKTLSEVARELGVDLSNLSGWLRRNHPEVLEQCDAGMMVLPSGRKVCRRTWKRFEPVAEYMSSHPSKTTVYVASKFSVPLSSVGKHISTHYPEIWERHCKACAAKAAKERERRKKEKEARVADVSAANNAVAQKYAGAVEAYASGELSMVQVAEEFGLERSSLGNYLRAHHPDLIENRRLVYHKQLEEMRRLKAVAEEIQREEWELRKAQRRYTVIPKYEPAVDEYRKGNIGLKPLADKYGLCNVSLRNYIGTRYPELIEAREKAVREQLDQKYAAAVREILFSKDSLDVIARRHGLSRNGLRNYIKRYGPHLMDIHKAVAGNNRQ